MHPSVSYDQQWDFPQDLAHCTTVVTDSSTAPGYELPYDSTSNFPTAVIDTAHSPLGSSASMEEHSPFFQELVKPMTIRRGAGRKPRRPYPVIVPNLTKKARGRQVPTKDMLLQPGTGRVFACPVESCRKVFTRSEHLKRHTRSIHTNEKRKCHRYPLHRTIDKACCTHCASQLSDAKSRTVEGCSPAMTTFCNT